MTVGHPLVLWAVLTAHKTSGCPTVPFSLHAFALLDLFEWLTRSLTDNLEGLSSVVQDFLRFDSNIGSLTLGASSRLVEHNGGVGQSRALIFLTTRQQNDSHSKGLTDANGMNRHLDVNHSISNSKSLCSKANICPSGEEVPVLLIYIKTGLEASSY